jgi:Transcription factor Tfb2
MANPSSSIYSYIESASVEDLDELYSSPWCALAVFQSLDPIAKQIVMRMLSMKGFVAKSFIQAWIRPNSPLAAEALRLSMERVSDEPREEGLGSKHH